MKKNYPPRNPAHLANLMKIMVLTFFPMLCSAQEFDYLDVNNIKAYINPLLLFNDGHAAFVAPKNSGKSTIYASSLWLSGYNQGNLHVAAHTFCERGRDFWLGPITNDYEIVDEKKVVSDAYIQKYHHTWKISRQEIDYHRTHYEDPCYVMSRSIAKYHFPFLRTA